MRAERPGAGSRASWSCAEERRATTARREEQRHMGTGERVPRALAGAVAWLNGGRLGWSASEVDGGVSWDEEEVRGAAERERKGEKNKP